MQDMKGTILQANDKGQHTKVGLSGLEFELTEDKRFYKGLGPDVSGYPDSLHLGDSTAAAIIELMVKSTKFYLSLHPGKTSEG